MNRAYAYCQRSAWYNWNRVRTTLLSMRLDSCFGLVGPLQQPVIDSNVDRAQNRLNTKRVHQQLEYKIRMW